MLASKIDPFKPLLESQNGVHLTAYLSNTGDTLELKSQISDALELAEEQLGKVMSTNEIGNFLAPIRLFQDDAKRLKKFTGCIGVFRTKNSFRAMNLPIEVDSFCSIADTFHVKPLLKWAQINREFFLLKLDSDSVSLYRGDVYSQKLMDTIVYPEFLGDRKNHEILTGVNQRSFRHSQVLDTIEWLNQWVFNHSLSSNPRLFIAGNDRIVTPLLAAIHLENASFTRILTSSQDEKLETIFSQVRSIIGAEVKDDFSRSLSEFYYAVHLNQAKGNLFAIAKAAVEGRIQKLIIAEGTKIFGKLNRKNGEITLNGRDIDHEDDDILDDIAQTVISYGGEITVAAQSDIPRLRPILAIIDESSVVAPTNQAHTRGKELKLNNERNPR